MEDDVMKKLLNSTYESYILIAQPEEFKDTQMYLKCYSMGMMSLLIEAFDNYPPLEEMARKVLKDREKK